MCQLIVLLWRIQHGVHIANGHGRQTRCAWGLRYNHCLSPGGSVVGRFCGPGLHVSSSNNTPCGQGYAKSGAYLTLLVVFHGFSFHTDEVTGCVREAADVRAHELVLRVHILAIPDSFFDPLAKGVLVLS